MQLFSKLATTFLIFSSFSAGAAPAAPVQGGLCTQDATHLCFLGDQFEVSLSYQAGPGQPGSAATAFSSNGSRPAYFKFDDVNAAESWVEVLNGCGLNGKIWVFGVGVSTYGWQLSVIDRASGVQKLYTSPFGALANPVQDLEAFDCATLQAPTEELAGAPLPRSMDLGGGRFRVKATYVDEPVIEAGAAQLTRDSGALRVFSGSPEVLVKIFKTPGAEAFYGVAASIAQNNILLEITDLCTGNQRSYNNVNPVSFAENNAFPAGDDGCGLFYDGFESATIAAWSATPVP